MGIRPEAVALDVEHGRIYVANTLGRSITIIDALSNKVIRTQLVGSAPYALAADSILGKLHVAGLDPQSFAVIAEQP